MWSRLTPDHQRGWRKSLLHQKFSLRRIPLALLRARSERPGASHIEHGLIFSRRTRRGERVYSRKCAFHVLLISSASYTECALYLARANNGQTARPSNYRDCFTNDCRGSEILEILREFD